MSGDALRQAAADELARHVSTMDYQYGSHPDTPVTLGCTCGFERGTVTKTELAADLDGHVRAYRLHVADAVIAVLGGEGSRLGADALRAALRGYLLDRCPTWTESFVAGDGLVLGLADAVTVAAQFIEGRVLSGPQSPPSDRGRAEGGGRVSLGAERHTGALTAKDERATTDGNGADPTTTEGRR